MNKLIKLSRKPVLTLSSALILRINLNWSSEEAIINPRKKTSTCATFRRASSNIILILLLWHLNQPYHLSDISSLYICSCCLSSLCSLCLSQIYISVSQSQCVLFGQNFIKCIYNLLYIVQLSSWEKHRSIWRECYMSSIFLLIYEILLYLGMLV